MRRFAAFLAFVSSIAIVACGPAPEPPAEAQGPTRADTVVMAMQWFDESVFDTVTWESDEVRSERGRLVYNISCSKCHGRHGAGDASFVMQGDTLRPPSFLEPAWLLGEAPMALRQYIFSGNTAGMPYWGLVGLKYRDIDAVAYFIETPLRAGISAPTP